MSEEQLRIDDDPAASNAYDALKNTADKVMQGLEKVRDHKEINRRRWVWELVQNAKDLPKRFGPVSIRLTYEPHRLVFAHNADPFRVKDVTALINQVSSKPSDSIDAQITGKYGTGFISTHLMSARITVKGVVVRQERPAKRMTLILDREGIRSEDLIPKIRQAQELVERIDSNPAFEDIADYQGNRTEDDMDTEFIYPLESDDAHETVRVGLADLIHTLPHTLGNLGDKVKRLMVDDRVGGRMLDYRCDVVEDNGTIRKLRMKAGEQDAVHFLSYTRDDITLTIEVNDFERPRLKPNFGEQPTLYRDFPLIGSEKFHFPFILNSATLYPTEQRNGIFLNDASSDRVMNNRLVIERAMQCAIEFGRWLAENGAQYLYVVAYSRMPEIDLNEDAKLWYKVQQKQWRAGLLQLPLVETATGTNVPLKDVVLPRAGHGLDVQAAFWDLMAPFAGYGRVPRKDLLTSWLKATGPSEEGGSWDQGLDLIQGLDDLFKQVAEKEDLAALTLDRHPEGTTLDPVTWLGALFQFAYSQNQSELLNTHAVVPDQYGRFHKLGELYLEHPESRIPDAILDVMKKLGTDWRQLLIHRDLNLGDSNHKRWGLADASKKMIELLGGERPDLAQNAQLTGRSDLHDILFELLSIIPPGGQKGLRAELFCNACRFYQQRSGEYRETIGCADFNFGPAMRLLLRLMHDRITECHNMDGLASFMAVSRDQAVLWLDDHLRSIGGNEEYKAFLERGNIIPNRYGDLIGYKDLYNYGTEDQPLDADLILVLQALDPQQNWNKVLVGDGIGIPMHETRTMLQLGKSIDDQVAQVWGKAASEPRLLEERQSTLVALIDWCNKHDDDAKRFMPSFMQIKDKLSFDLIIRPNLSSGVIGLLGDKRYGALLQAIQQRGMDIEKVKELLDVTGALGSLDEIISKAKEMLEEEQDFEYKKELGQRMEQLLKEALDSEGFQTHVQGIGDYDISVSNPSNGKVFYIELKSVARGSTDALKLAPSQAMAWRTDDVNRALCLIERGAYGSNISIEYVKNNLLTRSALAKDLIAGNDAYNKFLEVKNGQELDIQLLGDVRVRLNRATYLKNAGGYEQLIQAIRAALT
ncbi:MAG TPA: hypothetical protein PKD45_05565 [Flavobacteriales bacterium]|nr:hypothetical protein [Flavobacteriales bacterium]